MFSGRTCASKLTRAFKLIAAITSHFGETLVRLRFTEFVSRFVRLASRYEEVATGSTALGFASVPFTEKVLGSGVVYPDEPLAMKELAANASRVEGWRRTKTYQYCTIVRGERVVPTISDRGTGLSKASRHGRDPSVRSLTSTFPPSPCAKSFGFRGRADRPVHC